jgi:hypothetical protein
VEETTILEIREALFPISYQRTAKDKNGKVLSDAKLIYEGEPLELNSVPQGAIAFCTRGGPFILKGGHFAPKSKTTLSLMPGEKRNSLKISLEFSKEKVKVPAGTFDCYKAEVTIDPDSMMSMMPPGFKVPPGVLNLMKQFMPPINRWFSQEEPHYPVKSEGFSDFMMSSMSPSGISEPIAEELVSIERKAA